LHAESKLFASAADADTGRAHTFCKCLVVPLVLLDDGRYKALFVDGGARASVDRRSQWVQAVLAQGSPVPGPTPPQGGETAPTGSGAGEPGGSTGDDSVISDTAVDSALRGMRISRGARGRRALHFELNAAEPVTARLRLIRHRATLAQKTVADVQGTRMLKLAIPTNVTAGPAGVRLDLEDAAGNSKLVTKAIHIPSRRRPLTRP
jgi:hypothetical protein